MGREWKREVSEGAEEFGGEAGMDGGRAVRSTSVVAHLSYVRAGACGPGWVDVQPPRYANVREELEDFTKYSEAYQHYEIADASALPCTDLRRVLVDFDVSTALPLILYLKLDAGLIERQVSECNAVVESFIARRVFTREETKEYNKLFVEVIGSLRGLTGDQVKPALCRKLLSGGGTTRHWPTDEEIVDNAISSPAYRVLASKQRTIRR